MISQISLEYVLPDDLFAPKKAVSKIGKHQVIIVRISDGNLAKVLIQQHEAYKEKTVR
tara:strand:+ start:2879 stop:3052 length:174 start_codon:yes stop_codon:yes gene_type:complete